MTTRQAKTAPRSEADKQIAKAWAERKRELRRSQHEKNAAWKRQRQQACPRPDKRAYLTMDKAESARDALSAKDALRGKGAETMSIYRCDCGALHIGRSMRPSDHEGW